MKDEACAYNIGVSIRRLIRASLCGPKYYRLDQVARAVFDGDGVSGVVQRERCGVDETSCCRVPEVASRAPAAENYCHLG